MESSALSFQSHSCVHLLCVVYECSTVCVCGVLEQDRCVRDMCEAPVWLGYVLNIMFIYVSYL